MMETVVDTQARKIGGKTRTSWKKGQSGNPDGDAPWAKHKIYETVGMMPNVDGKPKIVVVTEELYKKAEGGDIVAAKEVNDRFFGKPLQGIELAGKNGGPIQFGLAALYDASSAEEDKKA